MYPTYATHVLAWLPGRMLPTRANGEWELYHVADYQAGRGQTDPDWCTDLPRDATVAQLRAFVQDALGVPRRDIILQPQAVRLSGPGGWLHQLLSTREPIWRVHDAGAYDGVVVPDFWTADLEYEAERQARKPWLTRCPACGAVSRIGGRLCGAEDSIGPRHPLR